VDDVDRLNSVDLVSSPATNAGLFESEDDMTEDDDEMEESTGFDVEAILKKLKATGAFSDAELQYLADSLAGDDDSSFGKITGGYNPATAADDPDRQPVANPTPTSRHDRFRKAVGLDSAGATGSPAPGGAGPDLDGNGQFAGGRGNRRASRIGNATTTERTPISSQESLKEALFSGRGGRVLNRQTFRETVKRQRLAEVLDPSSSIPIPTGADFARSIFGR
jgi:hypothetical protein